MKKLDHICLICGKTFETTKKDSQYCSPQCWDSIMFEHHCVECDIQFYSKRKKCQFCSDECRTKNYYKRNITERKEYRHKYNLSKTKVHCRWCKKPIPDEQRNSNVRYCSEECKVAGKKYKDNILKQKMATTFDKFKTSVGCQLCNYKYGGALDFHHVIQLKKKAILR